MHLVIVLLFIDTNANSRLWIAALAFINFWFSFLGIQSNAADLYKNILDEPTALPITSILEHTIIVQPCLIHVYIINRMFFTDSWWPEPDWILRYGNIDTVSFLYCSGSVYREYRSSVDTYRIFMAPMCEIVLLYEERWITPLEFASQRLIVTYALFVFHICALQLIECTLNHQSEQEQVATDGEPCANLSQTELPMPDSIHDTTKGMKHPEDGGYPGDTALPWFVSFVVSVVFSTIVPELLSDYSKSYISRARATCVCCIYNFISLPAVFNRDESTEINRIRIIIHSGKCSAVILAVAILD